MDGLNLAVVNYRSPSDLQHFLMSLEKHPPTVPWSLVVVNVAPQERDVSVTRRYVTGSNEKITAITFAENVGYARAVNRASLAGNYPVFAAFNADTRITDNVLDTCYDALQSHDQWGVLGPRQIDDEGRITHGGIFINGDRGFHQANRTEYTDIRDDAVTVSGAAYFIKRTVWEQLTSCPIYQGFLEAEGAFLPTPHYYEETFCSYHAIAHGWKVVYYGEACMIHRWHKASELGGRTERSFLPISRELFRDACDAHHIEHS